MKTKGADKILFLDACTPIVQIGILKDNKWLAYFKSEESALQSLFLGVEVCLKTAKLALKDLNAFAYCEGPGSLLGIRLAAMAICGWKEVETLKNLNVYAYNSFGVSLELIRKVHNPLEQYYVVSQSRRGIWNILGDMKTGRIREIDEEELISLNGSKWYLKQKKLLLEDKNLDLMAFDYNLELCPEYFVQKSPLRLVDQPDAAFVRELEYVKWDSKRHSMEDEK